MKNFIGITICLVLFPKLKIDGGMQEKIMLIEIMICLLVFILMEVKYGLFMVKIFEVTTYLIMFFITEINFFRTLTRFIVIKLIFFHKKEKRKWREELYITIAEFGFITENVSTEITIFLVMFLIKVSDGGTVEKM